MNMLSLRQETVKKSKN